MASARFPPAATAALGASLVAVLAGSLVTARLPAMSCSLQAAPSQAPLIVSAYLAAAGLGLPLGGLLGDAIGRRRLIGFGAALLAIASGACALATGLWPLLAGRIAQGAATALILPNAVAVIGTLPDARAATHRLPAYSAACTLATVAGPVLGGWAPGCDAWRHLFAVTALGGLAVAFAFAFMRGAERRLPKAEDRCSSPRLGLRAQAGTFVSPPMVALNLFTLLFFGAALSLLPLLALSLTRAREPVTALLPISLGPALMVPAVARLQRTAGVGALLVLAAASLGLAAAALILADPAGSYVTRLLPGSLLMALAFALASGPLSAALLMATPDGTAGLAAGVNSAAARLGGAGATMLLASAFAQGASLHAYQGALAIELLLACFAAAAALSFWALTRQPAASPGFRTLFPSPSKGAHYDRTAS